MTCPHGLAPGSCEICRVLGTGPAVPGTGPAVPGPAGVSAGRLGVRLPRLGGGGAGLVAAGVAVLVAFVVLSQVLAAAWALFRLLQVVAVAAVSGWIGYRVGVAAGRRRP
ncbi:MAG: hypothetical protein ACT4PX_01675 [Actinomycetota bacterium]